MEDRAAVNVLDFGATGNGLDDTDAIQRALEAAMYDDEVAYHYYADPENRTPAGPGRRRSRRAAPKSLHLPGANVDRR